MSGHERFQALPAATAINPPILGSNHYILWALEVKSAKYLELLRLRFQASPGSTIIRRTHMPSKEGNSCRTVTAAGSGRGKIPLYRICAARWMSLRFAAAANRRAGVGLDRR